MRESEQPDQAERLDPDRLRAVLRGENDPGYNPPDFPILTDPDPDDPGCEVGH